MRYIINYKNQEGGGMIEDISKSFIKNIKEGINMIKSNIIKIEDNDKDYKNKLINVLINSIKNSEIIDLDNNDFNEYFKNKWDSELIYDIKDANEDNKKEKYK